MKKKKDLPRRARRTRRKDKSCTRHCLHVLHGKNEFSPRRRIKSFILHCLHVLHGKMSFVSPRRRVKSFTLHALRGLRGLISIQLINEKKISP